jgi:hypothetical protein
MQNIDPKYVALVFKKNGIFFHRKFAQIADNGEYNIDT